METTERSGLQFLSELEAQICATKSLQCDSSFLVSPNTSFLCLIFSGYFPSLKSDISSPVLRIADYPTQHEANVINSAIAKWHATHFLHNYTFHARSKVNCYRVTVHSLIIIHIRSHHINKRLWTHVYSHTSILPSTFHKASWPRRALLLHGTQARKKCPIKMTAHICSCQAILRVVMSPRLPTSAAPARASQHAAPGCTCPQQDHRHYNMSSPPRQRQRPRCSVATPPVLPSVFSGGKTPQKREEPHLPRRPPLRRLWHLHCSKLWTPSRSWNSMSPKMRRTRSRSLLCRTSSRPIRCRRSLRR